MPIVQPRQSGMRDSYIIEVLQVQKSLQHNLLIFFCLWHIIYLIILFIFICSSMHISNISIYAYKPKGVQR